MNRKHLTTVLAGIGLAVIPSAAFAGEGDATAVRVDGVITISDCHAQDGSSNCTALSVLGQDINGSSQDGEGSSEDALIGGEDPSGSGSSLWLFRSRSNVDGSGNSQSDSSAVYLNIGGQVEVEVLRANANSNGDAESDGAYINIGGNEAHILHAQSTGGKGSAAAAILGGTGVLESGDDDGLICPLPLAPIAEADVICASGRRAGVVDNISALDGNVTGDVITANSRDAAPATPEVPGVPTNPTGGEPRVDTPPPLARTGADGLALLLSGLIAVGAGEALRRRNGGSFVSFA